MCLIQTQDGTSLNTYLGPAALRIDMVLLSIWANTRIDHTKEAINYASQFIIYKWPKISHLTLHPIQLIQNRKTLCHVKALSYYNSLYDALFKM